MMIFMNNSTLKFMSTMLYAMTIYFALSSKNIFMIWMMIELNMMTFIPLHNKYNINTYNNLMKYYLIQSISSALLLLIILMQHHFNLIFLNLQMMMTTVLLMKLGLFPFSSWYFQITENMEWKMWFLINTVQKIIPIWMISNFADNFFIISIIICNSLYSSIEMQSQNSIRWLLNCSSMNHISWMLININSNMNNWELYMIMYLAMSYSMFQMIKMFNNKTLMNNFNSNLYYKIMMCMNLMNFAGIPPMMGFLPKFLILYSCNSMMMMTPLIFNNMLMSYYYISMMKNMINNKIIMKLEMNTKISSMLWNLIMMVMLLFMMMIAI